MHGRDLAARIIGLLVFALGIGILVFSFYVAYHQLFASPMAGIAIAPAKPGGPPATTALSNSALTILIRLGALFIMVLVGSLVASRGVQMYFAGDIPFHSDNSAREGGSGARPEAAGS
jgi:hypothetical protein